MTENAEKEQKPEHWFKPGQSGNPAGKPKGARNRATVAAEQLLDGEADALTRKAIELATAGDTTALRLCIERILPARKDRPVSFRMPAIKTAADASKASSALLQAVAGGDLTPIEAGDVGKLIDAYVRALSATELEERIAKLESERK